MGNVLPGVPRFASPTYLRSGWRRALYKLFFAGARFFARQWHSCSTNGPAPLPPSGAALILANHPSHADPIFLTVGHKRRIFFLQAREAFKPGIRGWFFRRTCVPVARDGRDIAGLEMALALLRQGEVLVVFPEGDFSPDGGARLGPIRPGAAFLALSARVPIIPAWISYPTATRKVLWDWFWPFGRVRVTYGPPLDLSSDEDRPIGRKLIREVTDLLAARLERLRPAALRPAGRRLDWYDHFLMGLRCFVHAWHGCHSNGPAPLPRSGPAVIIANHRSHADPLFVLIGCGRTLYYLQARVGYESRAWGWLFRKGCIPVGADGQGVAGVRQGLRLLRQGKVLCVFPEGNFSPEHGGLGACQAGAAFLALHARVPVITAWICCRRETKNWVSAWFWPSGGVRVTYGPPVDLSPYWEKPIGPEVVREVTALLADKLEHLRRPGRPRSMTAQVGNRQMNGRVLVSEKGPCELP
jgi:1-acyl-sn-glycerol-3-phosphate acyltransferase